MTKEKKQAFTLRITSANSTELVEIIYEMTLEYINDADEALKANDTSALHSSIRKARGCLRELMESIDFTNEISGNLMSLYAFANKELILAEIRRNPEMFENVRKIFIPLRDTYIELAKQDDSEPIMSNAQTVVAGMTYSKNDINESMTDQNNRGFYV